MGPNNTKNSSLKCDFLIINYEYYCQNLVLIVKNTKLDQKTVSLLCAKLRVGPINSNILLSNEKIFVQASAL
jgi:hypothetical protein